MSKTLSFEIDEREAARLESEIDAIFAEIRFINHRMNQDRDEIDKLKLESRDFAAESKKLARETEIIASETRQRLEFMRSNCDVERFLKLR
ncbi:MAG: hypothetical protein MSG64_06065 [Pyrinomonadaceae bacterium MAG19_C2-C3]|nr:hypothetical protein [Pyrinomonadaceae bacterium MAG19_C2-C3]